MVTIPAYAKQFDELVGVYKPFVSASQLHSVDGHLDSVLITGLPGCGKTFFSLELSKYLVDYNEKDMQYVDCSELNLNFNGDQDKNYNEDNYLMGFNMSNNYENNLTLKSILSSFIAKGKKILILDQIEILVPKSKSLSINGIELLGFMQNPITYNDICKNYNNNILIIGITSNISSINSNMKIQGRFNKNVELSLTSSNQRYEVILYYTKKFPFKSNENKLLLLKKLSEITHGFVSSDLLDLCRSIIMNFEHRKLKYNNNNDAEIYNYVIDLDIEEAIKNCNPSNLLEYSTKLPKVELKNLYGISSIINKIENDIINPFKIKFGLIDHKKENINDIELPGGILIHGPPGIGKTVLALGIVNSLNIPCINIDASKIKSKIVGESEANVAQIFSQARSSSPCILLIDHMDVLLPNRKEEENTGSSLRVTTTFLTEMDGILSKLYKTNNSQMNPRTVLIIGITDSLDKLDPAAIRPGRIDIKIHLKSSNNDQDYKELIFGILSEIPIYTHNPNQLLLDLHQSNVSEQDLISKCRGRTPAELRNAVQETIFACIREQLSEEHNSSELTFNFATLLSILQKN